MEFGSFKLQIDTDFIIRLLMAFCVIISVLSISNVTFAATALNTDGNPLDNALCTVVKIAGGVIARTIAMLAIIAVGIGLFLGKLSWTIALATVIGIAIIFGAAKLITIFSGGQDINTMCGIS